VPALADDLAGDVGPATSQQWPDALARILAGAIIATVTAAVAAKLFGRKAGFAALLLSAKAHELLEAPLARRLSDLGL
jgi:hypothetical protein